MVTARINGIAAAALTWTSLTWAQPPSGTDTAELIAKARDKALSYSLSLPDFVATEIIRRYGGSPEAGFYGSPIDRLTIQLRYFQHTEEHTLIQRNGEPAGASFDQLHGLVGSGEFGSTISAIFRPASQSSFHFQKWITVKRRQSARFEFEIDSTHSHYTLESDLAGQRIKRVVGYHGVLEIDGETGDVMHLEYVADHVPVELGITQATVTIDYALTGIGSRKYLLLEKNLIEFRDYRKFSADSSIDFAPPK